MRILDIPDSQSSIPSPASSPQAYTVEAPLDPRVGMLEKVVSTLLQRLHTMEERVKTLEETPKSLSFSAVVGGESINHDRPPTKTLGGDIKMTVSLDSDAVKKNLLNKMWKYLNEQTAA